MNTYPEWISVKENLPNSKGVYLCWKKNIHHTGIEFHDVMYFDLDRKLFLESGGLINKDIAVKYWMPLPEPPKEEKDG